MSSKCKGDLVGSKGILRRQDIMQGYSVTTTGKIVLDDFITRRGVLLRFRIEEMDDRLKFDGRQALVKEIGEVVLKAMDAQETLDCADPRAFLKDTHDKMD